MSRFSYPVGRFSGVHLWPVLGVPRGYDCHGVDKGFSQIAYEVFHQAMGRKPADPNKILKGVRLGALGRVEGRQGAGGAAQSGAAQEMESGFHARQIRSQIAIKRIVAGGSWFPGSASDLSNVRGCDVEPPSPLPIRHN